MNPGSLKNAEALKEAGLTESQSKVYLALLELGDSTRGDIVATSGISGSKVYENLEKLHAKGLVAWYTKAGVKHFKPTNPNQLLTYLEEKKKGISTVEENMKTFLPGLLTLYNQSREEEEVEILHGIRGMETIFLEQVAILKNGEYNYVIGGTRGSNEGAMTAFFVKIHRLRQQKGIRTRMLYNQRQKDAIEGMYGGKIFSMTEVRYLQTTSPVAINIYSNRVVIIIFGREMTLIHIRSQQTADSFLEYFSLLWGQGSS